MAVYVQLAICNHVLIQGKNADPVENGDDTEEDPSPETTCTDETLNTSVPTWSALNSMVGSSSAQ